MVGSSPPRPKQIGPGEAPALSGPTWSMPAASTRAIEPPPAPIGVHVDHRHADRHRVLELELGRDEGPAVVDQGHVGRRAAHVVGDDARDARAAVAVKAAAMTPEAGPDITVCTAVLLALRADTVPPLPCMMRKSRV